VILNPKKRNVLRPKVGVFALASPLEVGADQAPKAAKVLADLLRKTGFDVVPFIPINNPELSLAAGMTLAKEHVDAVVFAITSWFEDYLVLDLLEDYRVPVLLWSVPGMETGALCGSQQLTAYLKQLDFPYHGVYGPLEKGPHLIKACHYLRACAMKNKLRRSRIGLIGHHAMGMTEVSANEIELKKSIGTRIVTLDLPQMLNRFQTMSRKQAQSLWKQVVRKSVACKVTEETGIDSMKVYLALKEVANQQRLDALAVGCYPHLMGRICLAASLLADEGIPIGCEGDVNGVVGQMILTLLTGEPTHNTDWLEPLSDDTVIFTHCGSGSFCLAEQKKDITLAPVRLMNQGVCALFPAKPGPVTLLNLLPSGDHYQCAMLEGEAISTKMVFPGNPLRVRFSQPTEKIIDWIHMEGIGHHWMAGYGHVGLEIRQWTLLVNRGLRLILPPT